jgi:hypothetical protein
MTGLGRRLSQQRLEPRRRRQSEPVSAGPFRCAGFPINLRAHETPRRYSVSPLPSFCTVACPPVADVQRDRRRDHAADDRRRRPAPMREREIEAKIVERLSEETEEERACPQVLGNARSPVGVKPKAAKPRTP